MVHLRTGLQSIFPHWGRLLFVAFLLIVAAVTGLAAYNSLQTLAIIVGGVFLLFIVLFFPEMVTVAVFFLLYSNALVVAVNFHNLPMVVGAAFPGLLAVPIGYYVIFRRQPVIVNPVLILMILYLFVQGVGGVFSIRPDVAWDRITNFLLEGIGIYFLTLNAVRSPKMLRLAILTIGLAGLLIGGLSFYQEVTGTYDNNYWGFAQAGVDFSVGEETLAGQETKTRLTGPIGEYNRFAQIMAVTAPLALLLGLGDRDKKVKILMVLAAFFIVVGGLLAYSRGGLVAMIVVAILMVLFRFIRLRHVVVLVVLAMLVPVAVPNFAGRMVKLEGITLEGLLNNDAEGGIQSADGSVRSRVTEMISAWLMFADYPIFGVGPGNYAYHYFAYANEVGLRVKLTTRQAHTLYGAVAAENGLLGLLCLFGIMYLTLRDLFRAYRGWKPVDPLLSSLAAGLFLAVIAYLVSGIFLHFAFIRYLWLVMGLAGAAASIYRSQDVPARKGSA